STDSTSYCPSSLTLPLTLLSTLFPYTTLFRSHPLRLVQNDFRNKIIVKLSYLKLYAKQMNRKRVGYSNDPFSIFLYRIIYFFLSESTSSCFLSKPIQV